METFYIIEHTYTIKSKKDGKDVQFTTYYQYSLTGNHLDGGNVFGRKEHAKQFESKIKARRIAREMLTRRKLHKTESYKAIEFTPETTE